MANMYRATHSQQSSCDVPVHNVLLCIAIGNREKRRVFQPFFAKEGLRKRENQLRPGGIRSGMVRGC
jgi:hypothetical protein